MPAELHKWFIEHTSPGTAHMIGVRNFLTSMRTQYQQVEIADTDSFGRILILDGKIQSAQHDEYIYHEALVHPAMLACPAPRHVLVTGGGEGATLREILRHPSVEKLVMVDLDQEVVAICREFLHSWHQGSFEDQRVELLYMDACQYLEDTDMVFDVIISDVPEPVEAGPALKLFTKQYFELIGKRLAAGGSYAMQAGDCCLPFIEAHAAIYNTVRQVMPFALPYRAFVPSFNTEWGFIVAAAEELRMPEGEALDLLIKERSLSLRYFDSETARSIFALPKNIRDRLNAETRIIDNENLITIY